MFYSKDYKEEYERMFNGYMMKIIKIEYIHFCKKKANREISLNEINEEGNELLDMLIGERDVFINEVFDPKKLELFFENPIIYKAVKSLTYKEKLAIFLFYVLEKNTLEIAKIMGYKDRTTAKRLCNRAILKINYNIMKLGGINND